jgi:hypothetical protein
MGAGGGSEELLWELESRWMLRFVEHRVGDLRLISLILRWLKASILEDEELHPNEEGTPQGGSISGVLSNVYLHYVLDLWFEPRGQASATRRGLFGAIHRRLCDVLPISLGRSSCPGGVVQEVEEVLLDPGNDQGQAR